MTALPGFASGTGMTHYLAAIHPAWHRFDIVNGIIGGNADKIRYVLRAFVRFQAESGAGYTLFVMM